MDVVWCVWKKEDCEKSTHVNVPFVFGSRKKSEGINGEAKRVQEKRQVYDMIREEMHA